MRITITGGSGFVGLAAAEALLARGHQVVILDRSPPPAAFACHPRLAGFRFVESDIGNEATLRKILRDERPDALLHAAAITSNEAMERSSAAAIIAVNVGGTASVATAAGLAGCRRIVTVSSIAVYGSTPCGPLPHGTLDEKAPLAPDSLYGITKKSGEEVARRLAELHGLDLTILRLGPLFGPWEHGGAARPDVSPHAHMALHGSVRLPHEMSADWLYSRDAAGAIADVLIRSDLAGSCFNLGAGFRSTPIEWAKACGLPIPTISPTDPTIAARLPPERPPLAIDRLCEATGFRGSRPIATAAADYLKWLKEVDQHVERRLENQRSDKTWPRAVRPLPVRRR